MSEKVLSLAAVKEATDENTLVHLNTSRRLPARCQPGNDCR
jgi:hypothetical protein